MKNWRLPWPWRWPPQAQPAAPPSPTAIPADQTCPQAPTRTAGEETCQGLAWPQPLAQALRASHEHQGPPARVQDASGVALAGGSIDPEAHRNRKTMTAGLEPERLHQAHSSLVTLPHATLILPAPGQTNRSSSLHPCPATHLCWGSRLWLWLQILVAGSGWPLPAWRGRPGAHLAPCFRDEGAAQVKLVLEETTGGWHCRDLHPVTRQPSLGRPQLLAQHRRHCQDLSNPSPQASLTSVSSSVLASALLGAWGGRSSGRGAMALPGFRGPVVGAGSAPPAVPFSSVTMTTVPFKGG